MSVVVGIVERTSTSVAGGGGNVEQISVASRATGISRITINRGIKELNDEQRLPPERAREADEKKVANANQH